MKVELTAEEMFTLRDALDDFEVYAKENLFEGQWYQKSYANTVSIKEKLIGMYGSCTLTTTEEEKL